MTHEEVLSLAQSLFTECAEVLDEKGHDYTEHDDRLADFIEDARDMRITVRQAWGVKFNKQVRAMKTWARGRDLRSEPLRSRVVDVINYALLGLCILADEELGRLPVSPKDVGEE